MVANFFLGLLVEFTSLSLYNMRNGRIRSQIERHKHNFLFNIALEQQIVEIIRCRVVYASFRRGRGH